MPVEPFVGSLQVRQSLPGSLVGVLLLATDGQPSNLDGDLARDDDADEDEYEEEEEAAATPAAEEE